jgi:hypothetical protein
VSARAGDHISQQTVLGPWGVTLPWGADGVVTSHPCEPVVLRSALYDIDGTVSVLSAIAEQVVVMSNTPPLQLLNDQNCMPVTVQPRSVVPHAQAPQLLVSIALE